MVYGLREVSMGLDIFIVEVNHNSSACFSFTVTENQQKNGKNFYLVVQIDNNMV